MENATPRKQVSGWQIKGREGAWYDLRPAAPRYVCGTYRADGYELWLPDPITGETVPFDVFHEHHLRHLEEKGEARRVVVLRENPLFTAA